MASEHWSGRVVTTESLLHSTVILPVKGTSRHRALCSCRWLSAPLRFYDAYAAAKAHREDPRD